MESEPNWINKGFVVRLGHPGIAFEGTMDECIQYCSDNQAEAKVLKVYYLRITNSKSGNGLGLKRFD